MVNEVIEIVTMTNDEQTDTAESANKAADKEGLLSVLDQCSDFMSSNVDWLFKDIDVAINEVSLEGTSTEYSITV